MTTSASQTRILRYSYGRDSSQFADLHFPAGPRRPGIVVLFHGGWWGPKYGADNLDAMASDLAGRGRLASGAPGAGPLVELAGVVSLAGILDLSAASRERIGNGAALQFVGASPEERPERYLVADPLARVPIPAAVYCVHGQADDRVPFTQAVTYVDAALAAGQHAKLLQVEGDHFSIADPGAPTWPSVITALEAITAAS